MTYDNAITALADPTRRAVFEALAVKPQSVADLAQGQPVSRPAVSQHLKVLVGARLVKATPQGTRRIYALDPTGLIALRAYLDRFWDDTLGAYAAEVRRQSAN
ncbi:ArsR/SmtB family transcription factor [Roseovarius aestuarii]|uniref:HTH-type transcriptional regulator n=1 Tax=Roseovarius aestuarii TaxID=475083 RepID=A0A1X7BXG0_9RHOB|nr:metalloregulator ArsR/SmtB family transcription factor [Roseovarius aestuarii]SMC14195.1 HTH-type transcriptional regulator [Roseovarius aestuarii]